MSAFFAQLMGLDLLYELQQFMRSGGWVLWLIYANCSLILMLVFDRLWFLLVGYRIWQSTTVEYWCARSDLHSPNALTIRSTLLSQGEQLFSQGLIVLRMLVYVCPLFGLLGTVTGMIEVFDVLAITGTGNARAMASGIARATIPTMAGMMVAIVGLFLQSRLARLSQKRQQQLALALSFHPKVAHLKHSI